MFAVFHIGPIEIEVALVESREWNGPPNDEIQTTVSAVIEGQHVTYTINEMCDPFAGWKEIEEHFNRVCAKYAFTERKS